MGAFRDVERVLVVRNGNGGTAAPADGAAGAVEVADVLEGEAGGESEGCGMASQDRTPLLGLLSQAYRQARLEAMRKRT